MIEDEFAKIVGAEYGEDAVPKGKHHEEIKQIEEASDRINAMEPEDREKFLRAIGMRLVRMGLLNNNGTKEDPAFTIAMGQACFNECQNNIESAGFDRDDINALAQNIATHLSFEHIPVTADWDPEEWVLIYRVAVYHLGVLYGEQEEG